MVDGVSISIHYAGGCIKDTERSNRRRSGCSKDAPTGLRPPLPILFGQDLDFKESILISKDLAVLFISASKGAFGAEAERRRQRAAGCYFKQRSSLELRSKANNTRKIFFLTHSEKCLNMASCDITYNDITRCLERRSR